MVTSTSASGAQTVLEKQLLSRGSQHNGGSPPPSWRRVWGSSWNLRAMSSCSEIAELLRSSSCRRAHSFTAVLPRLWGCVRTGSLQSCTRDVPKHPPFHPMACATGQYRAALRLEPAGSSVLVKLAASKDYV